MRGYDRILDEIVMVDDPAAVRVYNRIHDRLRSLKYMSMLRLMYVRLLLKVLQQVIVKRSSASTM
ncbi:hypothetical protein LCGC14_1284390 [marine sediment metagenome]|uniref:Uncharacterized protein n=1 Tax=marine sediment metagenome TaxID=412755 RepID=A0A0F9KVZ5_9ZZZZ